MLRNASHANYFDPDNPDTGYFMDKWLPEGSWNLVRMDVSSDIVGAAIVDSGGPSGLSF